MLYQLKKAALRSKQVIIALHIADNSKMRRKLKAGDVAWPSGSTHSDMELADSLDYVDRVYDDYIRYGGLAPRDLEGARVLEIGPGDNVGVALKFIVGGAREVVCLDRFYSKLDPVQQKGIYEAMRRRLPDGETASFDRAIAITPAGAEPAPDRIRYLYGFGIEEAEGSLAPASFDILASRAVLEHVYDPDKAMEVMDRLLIPGGLQVHKVDFTDHKMFSGNGHHPLTFLTIRDDLYRLMSRDTGRPNRRLIDWYRAKLKALGYAFTLLKTHVFGVRADIVPHKETLAKGIDYSDETLALLEAIRPRLLPRYRSLPAEDLMVSGIFLIARKPGGPGIL
jgi:hypothetical protein